MVVFAVLVSTWVYVLVTGVDTTGSRVKFRYSSKMLDAHHVAKDPLVRLRFGICLTKSPKLEDVRWKVVVAFVPSTVSDQYLNLGLQLLEETYYLFDPSLHLGMQLYGCRGLNSNGE